MGLQGSAAPGSGGSGGSNEAVKQGGVAKNEPDGQWHLYVLCCGDGSLYCGITNDVDRRLQQHRAGTGARYTRGRGPLELIVSWFFAGRSEASRAEAEFKKLSRGEKLRRVTKKEHGLGLPGSTPERKPPSPPRPADCVGISAGGG